VAHGNTVFHTASKVSLQTATGAASHLATAAKATSTPIGATKAARLSLSRKTGGPGPRDPGSATLRLRIVLIKLFVRRHIAAARRNTYPFVRLSGNPLK